LVTRADRTKRVDPGRADSYAELGRRLLHAGRAIIDQGDARHASALAILSIHAAIAFMDAAAIHVGGKKSTSGDHHAGPRLLREVMGPRLPSAIATALGRLVSEKDRFEYQGYLATMREASSLFAHATRCGEWVESVLMTTRRSEA
jgi:hypothetical protein